MADYTADTNCKLAYLFGDGSGNVTDSSGNSNTGTFNSVGHPAWSATVPSFGTSGSARGSASYSTSGSIEIISDGTSNTLMPYDGAFSFVGWIYPTVDTIGGGDPRIAARGSLYIALAATKAFYCQLDGATAMYKFVPNDTLTLNAWQHIAVTWDGNLDANNHLFLYKNGSLVTGGTYQNGVTPTSNAGATTYVGNRSDGTRSCGGLLTETAIFNDVLTDVEILDIYNYGLKPIISTSVKTVNGLARASVKTINGLEIASVKTVNGLA